jgi:hypothetical protein
MRVIDLHRRKRRIDNNWYWVTVTNGAQSNFFFDSFIIPNSSGIKVGLFDTSAPRTQEKNGTSYIVSGDPVMYQDFCNDGTDEHTFNFAVAQPYILAFKGFRTDTYADTVVAGANADLADWELDTLDIKNILDFSGQFQPYTGLLSNALAINADYISFKDCNLPTFEFDYIDDFIILTDAGGRSNVTLDYSGNIAEPTFASRAAYDNIISRGGTITGTPPPTS